MTKSLGFTYVFCNDLNIMKWFYSEVLLLDIIWEDDRSVAYDIAGHQFTILLNEHYKPPLKSFQSSQDGLVELKMGGYWSFPILDPMNNTIEITCTSREI